MAIQEVSLEGRAQTLWTLCAIFTKCLPSNIYNFCVFVRKFNIFSCSDKLEMRKIDKLGDYLSSFYSAP